MLFLDVAFFAFWLQMEWILDPKWSPKSPLGHLTFPPTDFGKGLENVFFSNHAPEAPEVDFGASGGGFGVDLEPPGVDLEWIWSPREC